MTKHSNSTCSQKLHDTTNRDMMGRGRRTHKGGAGGGGGVKERGTRSVMAPPRAPIAIKAA